jgi:hypothetical protein
VRAAGAPEAIVHHRYGEVDLSKESPIACVMAALDEEQRLRRKELEERLGAFVEEVRELADGYALRLPAGSRMVTDVAEFVTYERLCCPFLDFEIRVEREGGPLWLRLTGREGVKEFVRQEFGFNDITSKD